VSLSELRAYAEGTDPARYSCDVEQPVLLALLDVAEAAEDHSDDSDECITYPRCGDCRYCRLDRALGRLREVTS
jgi:hypothetical protein